MEKYCLEITDKHLMDEIFDLSIIDNNYLTIFHCDEMPFTESLKNKEKFIDDINSFLSSYKNILKNASDKRAFKRYTKVADYFIDNFDNILDKVDIVQLNLEYDVLDFINKYPILKNKIIYLNISLDIDDYKYLDELLEKYKDYNVHVTLEGNSEYVKLTECKKVMDKVRDYALYVKSLNLSPLENIMFIYDMVRRRIYTAEKDDNRYKSRDLKNILFSDEIVCAGYGRIVSILLSYLGISNKLISITDRKNEGHLRNGIYVDDDKYNVKGFYILDATFDSKKNIKDSSYINKYKHFMKSPYEIKLMEGESFVTEYIGNVNLDIYIDVLKSIKNESIYNQTRELLRNQGNINRIYNSLYNSSNGLYSVNPLDLIDPEPKHDINKIIDGLKQMKKDLNNTIPAEILIKLVNNVRKIEYYIDSNEYPYSMSILFDIFMLSNWHFRGSDITEDNILETKINGKNYLEDFKKVLHDEKIFNDDKYVKFTKILRNHLNNRK